GFEGLTLDPSTQTLFACLQSATIQDGALQYTRMPVYNISQPNVSVPLIGERVVVSSSGKVEATSEVHFVSEGVFLCLGHNGNGNGGSGDNIKYKSMRTCSASPTRRTSQADFDSPSTLGAPKGKLTKKVTPAMYVSFVDYADPVQLVRFGLHNEGDPDDNTLLDAKWESFALAPAGDSAPDDFFLFTAVPNNFLSTQGISLGVPYDEGEDVDNQFMVFHLTLPGASA
ncbi:hypothetical protein DFH07DRAFT_700864, partial [Mycena maculata]